MTREELRYKRTDSGTTEEKQGKENVGIIRSYSRLAV